jgi:hypothetical protein
MTDQDRTTWTRARAPGAEGHLPSMVVHWRVNAPAQNGSYIYHAMHEGRMQTRSGTAHVGSRLKREVTREGAV